MVNPEFMSPEANRQEAWSESIENYLKAIYRLRAAGMSASVQEIAVLLTVTPAGVSKMLRHLAKHGLIVYMPYQPVTLTPLGERVALEVIRHHRLLELYLAQNLGYGWDQVHAEAERLEHHISEEFEDTIDKLLGYPSFDPHGDPIPTRAGTISGFATETLDAQVAGSRVVLRRVDDEDPELLRYFGERGLRPGVVLILLDREPFGGSLRLNVGDSERRISQQAARHIFVEKLADQPPSEESVGSE